MADLEGVSSASWNPLERFNVDIPFFYVNVSTIINTWLVLCIIILLIGTCRYFFSKETSVIRHLTLSVIKSFMDLVGQTLGTFIYTHFAVVTSLFIFILFCNCIAVIPWTSEPTKDLNTALALGLVAFFYKEVQGIKAHGFWVYIKEFFVPIFLMLPINLIGHFSKVVSISFRLFGNIFGGAMIMELYQGLIAQSALFQIVGLFSGLNLLILLFFGIFEGLIQAFVFSMLTLTYITLAVQGEE